MNEFLYYQFQGVNPNFRVA